MDLYKIGNNDQNSSKFLCVFNCVELSAHCAMLLCNVCIILVGYFTFTHTLQLRIRYS